MREKKIRFIHPAKKEEQNITGTLTLPLKLGERAFIRYGSQSMVTSPVMQIWEVSRDSVTFETCHSLYRLSYTPCPQTEVMCA